ncbi:MAG: hypothetical protein AAF840_04725 [Bacteroidota bacterium]
MPSSTLILDENAIPRDFAVYQRFNRREDLEEVSTVLQQHDILVRSSTEDKGEWREATIIGSPLQPRFWIEIPASQFEKANFVLREYAEEHISEADLDAHPFAVYSRAELEQVLLEETEWSYDAVVVARKLLLRMGHDVDLKQLREAARAKLARDFAPTDGNGWVMGLFTLLGGFAALALWFISLMITIGVLLYYLAGSRRDPKGTKHWVYNATTRRRGGFALSIVGVCLVLGLLNYFWLHLVRFPANDVWYWLWF